MLSLDKQAKNRPKPPIEKMPTRPLAPLPHAGSGPLGAGPMPMAAGAAASRAGRAGLTGWVQDALGRLGFLDREADLLNSELEKGLRRLARTQADALLVQSLVGLGAALGSALGGSALSGPADAGGTGAQQAFAAAVRPALGAGAMRLDALSSRLKAVDEERARLNSRLVEAAFGAALAEERAQRDFERSLLERQVDFEQRKILQDQESRTKYWFDIFSRAIEMGAPPPDPDLVDEIMAAGGLSPDGKKRLYSWIDSLRQAQQFELARKAFEMYAAEQRLKLDWYRAQTSRLDMQQRRAQQQQPTVSQRAYYASSLLPIIRDLPAVALPEVAKEYKDKGINVYALHQLVEYEKRLANRNSLNADELKIIADLYYGFGDELTKDIYDEESYKYAQEYLRRLFPKITELLSQPPRRSR